MNVLLWSGLALGAVPTASIAEGSPLLGMSGVVAVGAHLEARLVIFCSGAVIAEGWVLTAAHCLQAAEDYAAEGWSPAVFAGDDLLHDDTSTHAAWQEAIQHPAYVQPGDPADLALLRLSRSLGEPIPLLAPSAAPEGAAPDWTKQPLIFVGFGATEVDRDDAGVKRLARIPVVEVLPHALQARAAEAGLCPADLGGAALIEDKDGAIRLAGVPVALLADSTEQAGGRCAGSGSLSLRLDAYADWIETVVGEGPSSVEDTARPADTGAASSGADDTAAPGSGAGGEDSAAHHADAEARSGGCAAVGMPLGLGLMLAGLGRRRRSGLRAAA